MSRIIAGSRKGRRLQTPKGDQTRPTTDRVREAVFSAISSWAGTVDQASDAELAGIAFCDLYAGSGAMGLEAASRGAAPVVLVEADRRTAELIRTNAATLDLPVAVHSAPAETLRRPRIGGPFDVIWLDPPYDLPLAAVDQLIDTVISDGWLVGDGLLVVERRARGERWSPPPGWESWERTYGETIVAYAQRGDEQAADGEENRDA